MKAQNLHTTENTSSWIECVIGSSKFPTVQWAPLCVAWDTRAGHPMCDQWPGPRADSDNAWPGAPLWPRLSNFISSVTSITRMNGPIVHQWPMTGVCSDQWSGGAPDAWGISSADIRDQRSSAVTGNSRVQMLRCYITAPSSFSCSNRCSPLIEPFYN